jgi:hypothetical protein
MGRQQPEPPRAAAGRQQGQQRTSAYTKGMRPYRANSRGRRARRNKAAARNSRARRTVYSCTRFNSSSATAAGLGPVYALLIDSQQADLARAGNKIWLY